MSRLPVAATSMLIALLVSAPVVLLAVPFWIIAGATRLVHRAVTALKQRAAPWQQLIEYAPKVGWKPRPSMRTYAYADKPFYVTTDADGWRGSTTLTDSDVVVFGDSYAFGYGVSDDACFTELSERVRIKPIGINGYNMVQELLWMRQLAPELKSKLVIWFVYHGNDLYENLQPNLGRYPMPYVRNGSDPDRWEIVTEHVAPRRWRGDVDRDYYRALAEICTPATALSRRAFSACDYLLREGRAVCDRAGAQLAVMSIPDVTQISDLHRKRLLAVAPEPDCLDTRLPDVRLGAACARLDVTFVPLYDHLRLEDHKLHDAHWNERGHRRVARLIESLYAKRSAAVASAAAETPVGAHRISSA
ncbi:MAG: hypothetical protein JXB36_02405 [Gammaproteobacteria bacterium]|nr:hypothetical protein [Gammaproteobacteria bacterium]